jgi:hypothetical protein
MEDYVIVYRPGGNIYQMLAGPDVKESFKVRMLKTVARAFITGLQIWWTLKS